MEMSLKPWLWISTLALVMGSALVSARDHDQNNPPRSSGGALPRTDGNYPDGLRALQIDARNQDREREKDIRDAEREHEKDWREYLKERRKEYKHWSRANRWELDDFDRYRRNRRNREPWSRGGFGGWDTGNMPRNGICFYTDSNYRGENYCVNGREIIGNVGERFNDRISSIRLHGSARRVVVYEHENFGGARRVFSGDVPNLGQFNDKISSVEIW
jgi:hypothetical protein